MIFDTISGTHAFVPSFIVLQLQYSSKVNQMCSFRLCTCGDICGERGYPTTVINADIIFVWFSTLNI